MKKNTVAIALAALLVSNQAVASEDKKNKIIRPKTKGGK